MLIFLLPISIIAIAILTIVKVKRAADPDFLVSDFYDETQKMLMINKLTQFAKLPSPRGRGIKMGQAKRKIKAYVLMQSKDKNGGRRSGGRQHGAENLKEYKRQNRFKFVYFKNLPHIDGVPRVYLFCSTLIKIHDGAIFKKTITDYVKDFNAAAPLNFDEISAFLTAFWLAGQEFYAICCDFLLDLNRARQRADSDIKKQRLNISSLADPLYLFAYYQNADQALKSALKNLCQTNEIPLFETTNAINKKIEIFKKRQKNINQFFWCLKNKKRGLSQKKILKQGELYRLLDNERVFKGRFFLKAGNCEYKKAWLLKKVSAISKIQKKPELPLARSLIEKSKREGVCLTKTTNLFFASPKAVAKTVLRWVFLPFLSVSILIIKIVTIKKYKAIYCQKKEKRLKFVIYKGKIKNQKVKSIKSLPRQLKMSPKANSDKHKANQKVSQGQAKESVSCFEIDLTFTQIDKSTPLLTSFLARLPLQILADSKNKKASILNTLSLNYISPSHSKQKIIKYATNIEFFKKSGIDFLFFPPCLAKYILHSGDKSILDHRLLIKLKGGFDTFSIKQICLDILFLNPEKKTNPLLTQLIKCFSSTEFLTVLDEKSKQKPLLDLIEDQEKSVFENKSLFNFDTDLLAKSLAIVQNLLPSQKINDLIKDISNTHIDYKNGLILSQKKQNLAAKKISSVKYYASETAQFVSIDTHTQVNLPPVYQNFNQELKAISSTKSKADQIPQFQDTAGACFFVKALILSGQTDFAFSLFKMLCPSIQKSIKGDRFIPQTKTLHDFLSIQNQKTVAV
ncbi:MAG: hypothetical protein FWD86_02160, partial [Firmicutes bacterium]|nr:hypothetical protein [Bacillota bacterium]